MIALRHMMAARRRALLAFVLAVLGIHALVPAGTMIAPAGEWGASIILCPETHPLARALGTTSAAPDMAALHAAMGHGEHHDGMDHGAIGHSMAPADDDAGDPAPSSPTAAPVQACAFAGLALAALLTEQSLAPFHTPPTTAGAARAADALAAGRTGTSATAAARPAHPDLIA